MADYTGSLAQRAYASLRDAIVALRIAPGAPLRKADVCDTLGVSRSPVSEAVTRLQAEGLVKVVPQAGTFVARLDMTEIREGAFLREAIECAAIEQIAPQITEEQLTRLRRNLRLQALCVEEQDYAEFYAQDAALHRMLLEFTGFPNLARVSDTAWVHVDRARQLILPDRARVRDTLSEHEAILAALEARTPAAARDALRAHLRQLIRFLEPLETQRPELFEPR